MVTLNELARKFYTNSKEHGFYDEGRSFDRAIALIHGEVSEAHEEFRSGHDFVSTYYREDGKPEGVPSEMADIIIRVLDTCGYYGINIDKALAEKHDFNVNRPYKHGRQF